MHEVTIQCFISLRLRVRDKTTSVHFNTVQINEWPDLLGETPA